MKLVQKKWSVVVAVSILVLFSLQNVLALPQEAENSNPEEKFPEKISATSGWEKIVSFPGLAVFFPVKILLKGTSKTIGWVEETKIAAKVQDILKSDDERRALVPTYSARTGYGFKIYQRDLLNPNSKLTLSLSRGHRQRQNYNLEFKRIQMLSGLSRFNIQYQLLSDEPFFGLGLDSEFENESNFAHEQFMGEFSYEKKLVSGILFGMQGGIESNKILRGKSKEIVSTTDVYTRYDLPGLSEKVEMGRVQFLLSLDTRNRLGNPTSGWEALATSGIFTELQGDEFRFTKSTLDIKRYVHLFYNRYLVFRVAGEQNKPLDNSAIPFYYLSELGERETIRGFERGRYRDRDKVLGSLEYRYPLTQSKEKGIEAILFVDAGQVANNLMENFAFDRFKIGFGGGFRIFNKEGMVAKVEFSRGTDGFRFYLVLN